MNRPQAKVHLNNLSVMVGERAGLIARHWDFHAIKHSLDELDKCIVALYEMKRTIMFLKNTVEQPTLPPAPPASDKSPS